MDELNKIEKSSIWYESQTWLRALVQLVPSIGGSIDLLFSVKATKINTNRVVELIEQVSEKLQLIDNSKLNKNFLESEEFFEIFRRCTEMVTRIVSTEKRKLIADYLSGVIQTSVINDISVQLLEDLNSLQEFHLQVLAALPDKAGETISNAEPPEQLNGMPKYIYSKAICDLERIGFLEYIATWDTNDSRKTTEYLVKFKETFKNI